MCDQVEDEKMRGERVDELQRDLEATIKGRDREKQRAEQFQVAIQDLLSELRIDATCLVVMAKGYSPDYPGAVDWPAGDPRWKNPYCRVQLSKVVAEKLVEAGVLPEIKKQDG